MTTSVKRRDPLGRLADVLAEDVLATPGAELLAESAEDYGNAVALSAEFEKAIEPLAEKLVTQDGIARAGEKARLQGGRPGAAPASGRWWPFRLDPGMQPSGQGPAQFAGERPAARPFEWAAALWRTLPVGGGRIPRGLQAALASVLVFVAVAGSGSAVLLWANRTPRSSLDEFTRAASPAVAPYAVQLSWQRNQEDAVANLLSRPDLRARFPSLRAGQESAIRQGGRNGAVSLAGFTMEQARDFCEQFKTTGGECKVGLP